MIKGDDIDKVGKRLYDLESDPPKRGWEKIHRELHPTNDLSGVIFKKHGWKGLILLIPVLLYFLWPENIVSSSINSLDYAEVSKEVPAPINPSEISTQLTTEDSNHDVNYDAPNKSQGFNDDRNVLNANKSHPNNETLKTQSIESDSFKQNIEQTNIETGNLMTGVSTENEIKSIPNNDRTIESKVVDTSENNSHQESVVSDNGGPLFDKGVTDSIQTISNDFTTRNSSGNNQDKAQRKNTVLQDSIRYDSIMEIPVDNPNISDMLTETVDSSENSNQSDRKWKLIMAFEPQYIMKSVSPVTDDEIYVTGISNDASEQPQRTGYSFAIGAGKEVFNNITLETHLAFYKLSDNYSYSYTTGALDTLITYYRADGVIEATPVYKNYNREVSVNANFGSMKLGITWFPYASIKHRINISAFGTINYALSYEVKEKVGENWMMLDSERDRLNTSFIIGAGYSFILSKTVDLNIMPVYIYSLNSNNQSQLLNIRQDAYAIQLRILKTL